MDGLYIVSHSVGDEWMRAFGRKNARVYPYCSAHDRRYKKNVIAQAEHICGSPKMVAYGLEGTPDAFEVRRYTFTVEKDLVLYFYSDVFVQAKLMEPQSNKFPNIRRDYKEVKRGAPGSVEVGYLLKRDDKNASIESITDGQKK